MFMLVFWDLIPTYAMYQYHCAQEGGFYIYTTPEQWASKNKNAVNKLHPIDGEYTKHDGARRFMLNQRLAWEIINTNYKFHIVGRKERIVDIKSGEVLAEKVDFNTDILGVEKGTGARGIYDYKGWLHVESCPRLFRKSKWIVDGGSFSSTKNKYKYIGTGNK